MPNKLTDRVRPKGQVTVRVFGPDGALKYESIKKNLVVDAGLALTANRWASATPLSECLVNYIAVGTGVTAPAATDTQLQTETARKAVLSRSYSGTTAAFSTTFGAGEVPVSTLKELGLFIDGTGSANSGTLLAHFADSFAVTALDSVFIDWRITLADA